ncbi:hypothetical protein AVEN_182393-1 [Araneus ventricosus]|uniref:Uncharacterized protein n=1 Tax=Araneus ventricosus TaxID=182803 RepID=A0A4Y2W253_ARAVE|nr:hypothetical protein AVEN_43438-1 [Araneus ventricosus]GBO31449.1 hypothetical protein AVEN_182393-1 [Araneus ventricosus]
MHFGKDRFISPYFIKHWPQISHDPESLRFLAARLSETCCDEFPIANLAELKTPISQHIENISADAHLSVVEHAISRFQLVAENGL